MSVRPFAKIGCSLPQSRAMRSLPDHTARWAYLCLHLSALGNYQGVFYYPVAMLAADLPDSLDEAERCLCDLEAVGLIEWDRAEQYIRLTRWHLKDNAPTSQSVAISRMRDLRQLRGPDWMVRRNRLELAIGILRASEKWNPEHKISDQMNRDLRDLIRRECRSTGQLSRDSIVDTLVDLGADDQDASLWLLIREFLPDVVLPGIMLAPSPHDAPMVAAYEDETETKKRRREDGDGDGRRRRETAKQPEVAKGATPPARRSRGDAPDRASEAAMERMQNQAAAIRAAIRDGAVSGRAAIVSTQDLSRLVSEGYIMDAERVAYADIA